MRGEIEPAIPLGDMESLRPIEFPDALARLQGMLGREVAIAVSLNGRVPFDGSPC